MSSLDQIAKDELLGRLSHAQAEQARAAATDGLVLVALTPGADRQVACVWCLEAAGWCDATGGPNLCEGHDAHVLAVADAITAPEIRHPIRTHSQRRLP
jgi:hypothetical protein